MALEQSVECNCDKLDDDLIDDGYTCYNCYEFGKDNPDNLKKTNQESV